MNLDILLTYLENQLMEIIQALEISVQVTLK